LHLLKHTIFAGTTHRESSREIRRVDPTAIRSFSELLFQLQRGLGWTQKNEVQCCGVTMAQCHVLLVLKERGDSSIVDLSGALGVDTSTLSRTVDTMCKADWVDRSPNPKDRRYVSLTLTDQGRSLVQTIQAGFDAYMAQLFASIPEDRHAMVVESVGILAAAIGTCQGKLACCETSTPRLHKTDGKGLENHDKY
jgi:DNA-binding MarR family transcriptional regulator